MADTELHESLTSEQTRGEKKYYIDKLCSFNLSHCTFIILLYSSTVYIGIVWVFPYSIYHIHKI